MVNLTVDDSTGSIINASAYDSSISIAVGSGGDAMYYEQQARVAAYASEAIINDPVVGVSGFMPLMRSGNVRLCFGGECPGGRLYAEAMRFVENTDVAVTSSGAFRSGGWPEGSFTVSQVWAISPFPLNLCSATLRGVSLFEILNFSTAVATAPSIILSAFGDRLLQTAGLKMVFNNLLSETRLLSVHVLNRATRSYEELNRIAVDSYMATIFSPFPSFFNARYDGEVAPACSSIKLTQTAVVTYMAELSFVNTPNQGNLMIDNTSINVLNLVQTQNDCVSGTFWHPSTGSCMACPQGTSSTPGENECRER